MKNFIKGGLIVGGFLAGFALPVQLPLANAIPTDMTGQQWAAEQVNPQSWAPLPTPTPTPSESKPKPAKSTQATKAKPSAFASNQYDSFYKSYPDGKNYYEVNGRPCQNEPKYCGGDNNKKYDSWDPAIQNKSPYTSN